MNKSLIVQLLQPSDDVEEDGLNMLWFYQNMIFPGQFEKLVQIIGHVFHDQNKIDLP